MRTLELNFVLFFGLFVITHSFLVSLGLVFLFYVFSILFFGPTVSYLAPAIDVTSTPYRFPHFSAPRISGISMRLFVYLIEGSSTIRGVLRRSNKLDKLDQYHIPDHPTAFPIHYPTKDQQAGLPPSNEQIISIKDNTIGSLDDDKPEKEFRFNTIKDYHKAYSSGILTPLDVAENLIKALKQCKLKAIVEWNEDEIRKQAKESTERFEENQPRSLLEGVPISVKDQINVLGFETSKGRTYSDPAIEDATVIQRLRDAGALLYGKANQTEMGIHVTGLNANKRYGHCRNAYNPNYHTGGSSSGSGSAVAAGLGPVSIAADGGGSIRIPASFCGQVGLKPTCGLVPLTGDTACFGSSVDVVGPVATTAQDAAIVMSVISGQDINDPLSTHSPPLSLGQLSTNLKDLKGVKIGVYNSWFDDSPPHIVEACRIMINHLLERGAEYVNIEIPELELMVPAHVLAITSEMFTDVHTDIRVNPSSFTLPTRILFALTGENSACDYIQSGKVRTRMMLHFKRVLSEVDVIVTPANGTTAPPIPNLSDTEEESDITKQDAIMRYMHAPNLTGLPACVFPVSYTKDNLPISFQCITRPWQEDLLLRIAATSHEIIERKKPQVYFDLLKKSS